MKIRLKITAVLMLLAAMGVFVCAMLTKPAKKDPGEYVLPVLLYHHFAENVTADTVVSPARFREQMTALKEAGYTAVTLRQVVDYVENGQALPEKAVLITMDDGYTSNLTVAAPILEELGMCATVFVIGIYEGETISPNTGNPLYPARFAFEDAAVWVEKGVLDLQCHSYNMHQLATDGLSGRDGMLPLPGESAGTYHTALRMDVRAFIEKTTEHFPDAEVFALAYPYGYFTDELRDTLYQMGICATFTVVEEGNVLRVGQPECLWNLGRLNVTERDSGAALVRRLDAVYRAMGR